MSNTRDLTKEEVLDNKDLMVAVKALMNACKTAGIEHIIMGVDIADDAVIVQINQEDSLDTIENK